MAASRQENEASQSRSQASQHDNETGDESLEEFITPGEVGQVIDDTDHPPIDDVDLNDYTEMHDTEAGEMTSADAERIARVQAELHAVLAADKSIQGFFDHADSVFCVAFSPSDASIAVSGDQANAAYLWNTQTGEKLHKLEGHTESVVCCGFSSDGALCATGDMDGHIRVWRTATGQLAHALEGPSASIECIAWHPRGQVLLAGCEDGTAWLFNAATGECMMPLSGHSDAVNCCAFSADGKLLLTASADGSLRVWNPRTGMAIHYIRRPIIDPNDDTPPITAMAVKPTPNDSTTVEPRLVCVGAVSGNIAVVNIDLGKPIQQLSAHSESVESIAFCPQLSTHLLASTSVDGTVYIHDLSSGQRRTTIRHKDCVTCCRWVLKGSRREPLILSASLDFTVRLSDARNGVKLHEFTAHQDAVLALDVDTQQRRLVTASDDQTCLVFDLHAQLEPAAATQSTSAVSAAAT